MGDGAGINDGDLIFRIAKQHREDAVEAPAETAFFLHDRQT